MLVANGSFENWEGYCSSCATWYLNKFVDDICDICEGTIVYERPTVWSWDGLNYRIYTYTTIVQDGNYSVRFSASPYNDIKFLSQDVNAVPYRGKVIALTLWGSRGPLMTNCYAYLSTDGTSPINESVIFPSPWGQLTTISGTVPADATYIRVRLRAYCSQFGPSYVCADYVCILIAPTVTTQAVSSIAGRTAIGNGNITDLGDPNPTAHGVCWNTTGTPTTSDSKTDEGAASATGAFTTSMTGLTPGWRYYVRAYATNIVGTSYGDEVEFFTSYGEASGSLAIKGTTLRYVDETRRERYIEGQRV